MIQEILAKEGLDISNFSFYGEEIVKVKDYQKTSNKRGKLILVTSTSPTKYGEGKTTLAISTSDALNRLGKKSIVSLREPSLGPVFGLKGGATGGGMAKVLPEDEINLHFTGDIHAVTTCNNLLSAIIDNHIYQGNELNIQTVTHERCLDLNDRSLRHLIIAGKDTGFNISTASEIMAILCLCQNEQDLKERLSNILVGYNAKNEEVFVKDLKCVNALMSVLKNALKPNLVRTKENNLAIIHGGPFANIAHGTNSVIAQHYALYNFEYTLVEAGFGSDMGAVKYYDIITRNYPTLKPDIILLNTTIQSLKYHGEGDLKKGLANLEYHLENMQKYNNNLIVVLNKHDNDKTSEIDIIKEYVQTKNLPFSISEGYTKGSIGTTDLAQKIIDLSVNEPPKITYSYDIKDDLKTKITKFCQQNYHAQNIIYTKEALEKLNLISQSKFKDLPICIAKTEKSISDNANILGYPKDFTMTVKNLKLFSGAGFITVYFGNILTMPGLTKDANYLKMED